MFQSFSCYHICEKAIEANCFVVVLFFVLFLASNCSFKVVQVMITLKVWHSLTNSSSYLFGRGF